MNIPLPRSEYISVPEQAERLDERRHAQEKVKLCAGMEIVVFPGVYGTSTDTELMIDTIDIHPQETFLEIGCGTGVISIALAKQAKSGVGVDINEQAIANSRHNAEKFGIQNVTFIRSDVFSSVQKKFDVVICNPPYGDHDVADDVDRMFWDPENDMKLRFFKEVQNHLSPHGKIYFGWANFADIDVHLPQMWAEKYNLVITKIAERRAHNGKFNFYVYEFSTKK